MDMLTCTVIVLSILELSFFSDYQQKLILGNEMPISCISEGVSKRGHDDWPEFVYLWSR